MSAGNKARVPIPVPPHHVQQPQTTRGASNQPPVPPHHRKPNLAAADYHDTWTHDSARNVSFAEQVEYEAIDRNDHQQNEVSIELGESAAGEDDRGSNSSDSKSSGRSDISHAPSVEHFNISFEFKKTFREHKGARTMKAYHKILKLVYNQTLAWSYNILLFVFGIVLTLVWGVLNALVAFIQTWFISPVLRVSLVIIRGLLPIILEPVGLILKTCAGACGCGSGWMGGMAQSLFNRQPGRSFGI